MANLSTAFSALSDNENRVPYYSKDKPGANTHQNSNKTPAQHTGKPKEGRAGGSSTAHFSIYD